MWEGRIGAKRERGVVKSHEERCEDDDQSQVPSGDTAAAVQYYSTQVKARQGSTVRLLSINHSPHVVMSYLL